MSKLSPYCPWWTVYSDPAVSPKNQASTLATPLKASNSSHHQKTEALWELILRMVFIFLQDAGGRERTLGATEKYEVRVTPVLGKGLNSRPQVYH